MRCHAVPSWGHRFHVIHAVLMQEVRLSLSERANNANALSSQAKQLHLQVAELHQNVIREFSDLTDHHNGLTTTMWDPHLRKWYLFKVRLKLFSSETLVVDFLHLHHDWSPIIFSCPAELYAMRGKGSLKCWVLMQQHSCRELGLCAWGKVWIKIPKATT